ncbi:putative ribonuclease H-like domain-containing protein [Tanacetum coccineum]
MDLETAQTTTTAKLPILKQENGNSFKPAAQTTTNADGTSTSLIPGLVTTKEKVQKKNDVKARSMLLMALPNEHLMTFNQYKDAKTLFAAIQTRFGGNEATKKTQKTLLKQMYENFSAPSTESLDSIFNRLQKIVSQLAILGENISQEDLNLKFLRSLPSEWNTHVVVWRNKPDLDTMSFDDLYNNFKIVEQEVKRTASSSSSSQNMAFVSSLISTNEANTAYGVSTADTQVSPTSTQVSTTSTQVSTANLSDDTVYAFLASQPNGSQLVYEDLEQIHKDDIEEIDLKWQLALLSMKTKSVSTATRWNTLQGNAEDLGTKIAGTGIKTSLQGSYMADDEVPTNMALMAFSDSELEKLKHEKESNQLKIEKFNNASKSLDKLIGSQITDKSRKSVGFVSYNVVLPPHTGLFSLPNLDLSYSGLEEFQQPDFEGYGPKPSKSVSEDISNDLMESLDAPLVEELVLDDKLEKKIVSPTVAKIEFVRPKQQEKPVRKPVKYAKMYRSQSPRVKQRNKNNQKSQQLGSDFVMYNIACFVCGSFDHVQAEYNYHQKGKGGIWNMVPRAVFMKTGLRSLNTARPVNTAHPKTTVYSARPLSHFSKSAQSTVKRPYQIRTSLTNKSFSQKVNTAKGKFYTARPKAVNTARPNSAVVNAVRVCHPQKEKIKAMLTVDDQVENLVDKKVKIIRFDNGTEFKNRVMSEFCEKKGIKKEFSVTRTPQQNGVAERRNRTLIEATRTMLANSKLPTTFWAEVVNTSCYVQNMVLVVEPHNKTPYELFRSRTPVLSFMLPFGCYVTIFNTLDYLGKFDKKSDEGFLVGYLMNSKAFRVYIIRTRKVKENLHIRFLEDKPIIAGDGPKWLFDIDVLTKLMNYVAVFVGTNSNDFVERPENSTQDVNNSGPSINTKPDMFSLGDNATLEATHADFFSDETKVDMSNITTTYPVPSTLNTRIHKDHSLDHVIGDVQSVEPKKVIQALTDPSWIEAMQDELLQLKLQKMDVKSALLYGKIEEEVYVCQPLGFEDLEFPNRVYKVEKELYGLHQAPRAWYETLKEMCTEFEKMMHKKFQISSMGELTFFLGLQVTQKDDGIFISQDKYVDEILKKFGFSTMRITSTPMETSKPLLKDAKAEDVDV